MSVHVGTRLGSLEITALLGKGGMGEVYSTDRRYSLSDFGIGRGPDAAGKIAARANPCRGGTGDSGTNCGGPGGSPRAWYCPSGSKAGKHEAHARWKSEGPGFRFSESISSRISDWIIRFPNT